MSTRFIIFPVFLNIFLTQHHAYGVDKMLMAQILKSSVLGAYNYYKESYPNDWSKLHRAASTNYVSKIDRLIKNSCAVNLQDKLGSSPLHVAVMFGHKEAAIRLLKAGAHVNARDIRGQSPLHFAVFYAKISLIEVLINYGADIHASTCDKITRLLIASTNKNKKLEPLLLKFHTSKQAIDSFKP